MGTLLGLAWTVIFLTSSIWLYLGQVINTSLCSFWNDFVQEAEIGIFKLIVRGDIH